MTDPMLIPRQVPWECDFLAASPGRIFRAWAVPDTPAGLRLAVFCNPMGEEAKSSFGTLSSMARALWSKGWGVARFDYPGTGDSEGDFSRFLPEDWIQSCLDVIEDLRQRVRIDTLVLLGVRLGGNVAIAAANRLCRAQVPVAGAVLWTPAADIRQFVQHLRWVSPPGEDGAIDHLGWRYSPACLAALPETLGMPTERFPFPVLLANISAKHKDVPKEVQALAARLQPPSQFIQVQAQPFWERISTPDDHLLIDQTLQWLEHLCR